MSTVTEAKDTTQGTSLSIQIEPQYMVQPLPSELSGLHVPSPDGSAGCHQCLAGQLFQQWAGCVLVSREKGQ